MRYRIRLALGACGLILANTGSADDLQNTVQLLQQQLLQIEQQLDRLEQSRVATDTQNPFAELATPNVAYALLQQQTQYPALLTLGGSFSAAAQAWRGTESSTFIQRSLYNTNGEALAATSADLYVLANPTQWIQTFVTVEGGLNGYDTILSQAFVTLGNLNKTPFYATMGNTNLPFGVFPGNGLVAATPENNAFASTQVGQIDVGFSRAGFNTTLAVFNGASNFNDFVYSAQYTKSINTWTLGGGAGYLYDLRYTGSSIAAAYNTSNGRTNTRSETLKGGRNGAVDVNGNVGYNLNANQSLSAAAEWITTTNSPETVIGGIETGRMQAWTVAATYLQPILNDPTSFTVSYSAAINMEVVPLQLPGPVNQSAVSIIGVKNQWLADFQSVVMKNVAVGPEFAWINLANNQYTWETAVSASIYL